MRHISVTPSAPLCVFKTTERSVADRTLSIRTFGRLEVSLDGKPIELPASRKTRALLAFLVLSGDQQRRARLCELLWDTPDDPRSSLRWSLTKLRSVVNAGGRTRLHADREQVRINPEAIAVDFHDLRACADNDDASIADLSRAWELSNQTLIEDCELPNQPHFMTWLREQRKERARLRVQLSRRLALSPDLSAEEAQQWAQRWMHEAPSDPYAARQFVVASRRLGRAQLAVALASDLQVNARDPGLEPLDTEEFTANSSDIGAAGDDPAAQRQVIRYVRAEDDTAIAWASAGADTNPPLVKAGSWLTHLELEWDAPVFSPLFRELARTFRFIRYDDRGCGLSDWDVPEISFETLVGDLEKVVDAAGLERFPLLGISQGAPVAIEYAARHPERVSYLILFGGYAAGWRHTATPEESREREAVMVLTAAGWGRSNPSYRSLFTRSFMPGANSEEVSAFDEFQRRATSPKNAVRFLETISSLDVRHRLQDVQAPTLVLHSQGDAAVPISMGHELAQQIPHAEFATLDSNNHLLLGREPAANQFLENMHRFLLRDTGTDGAAPQSSHET